MGTETKKVGGLVKNTNESEKSNVERTIIEKKDRRDFDRPRTTERFLFSIDR